MKRVRSLLVVFLLLGTLVVSAQGAYLEKGVNGIGSEARVVLGLDGFKGLGIVSGYSIAGILDVGGSVDYSLGELEGLDSTDLRAALDYGVNVLKQSARVPLSLQIKGSYGIHRVLSEYLDNTNATRRGTGYTLGLNLATNIRLTPSWLIRVSLFGDYGSTKYITLPEGALETTPGVVERAADLYFGGGLGFLFAFPQGAILAVQAELRADRDLELQINPILSVAFPQR